VPQTATALAPGETNAVGRMLGLHRVPAELASIRRRLVRKYRKLTRDA